MNTIKVTYHGYDEVQNKQRAGELEELAYIDLEDGNGCCILEFSDSTKLLISTLDSASIDLIK